MIKLHLFAGSETQATLFFKMEREEGGGEMGRGREKE